MTQAEGLRKQLNGVVLKIMAQRPYGPVTLKDYLDALEAYEASLAHTSKVGSGNQPSNAERSDATRRSEAK